MAKKTAKKKTTPKPPPAAPPEAEEAPEATGGPEAAPRPLRLYEISAAVAQIVEAIEERSDPESPDLREVDPETGATKDNLLQAWIDLDMAFDLKVERSALACQEITRRKEAVQAEISRLRAMEATLSSAETDLKGMILTGLSVAKKKRVDGERIKVWAQNGAPSVVIEEGQEDRLPDELQAKIEIKATNVTRFRELFGDSLLAMPEEIREELGVRVTMVPNKTKIKDFLKAKTPVNGATLREGRPFLRIK